MSRCPVRFRLLALLALVLLPTCAQAAQPGRGSKAPTHRDTPHEIHVDLAATVRESRLAGVRAVSPDQTQSYLPTTWCGTETTTDDAAHSTLTSGQAYYKLVYAYASDQPDRFSAWQDVLQADVSLIGQYMALQDGATKSPRFDMGTSCGPEYVDIQVVRLPGLRADYADNLNAIESAVGAQLGSASGPRNVVVLADGLTTETAGSIYGLGEHWTGSGDIPGASNPHNSGGLYAVLFPWLGLDPSSLSDFTPGFWPEGMLHEITHTLGAVNSSSPHHTDNGHCTDGYDVMCYADGSTQHYTSTACPQLSSSQAGMTQTYDCNHDDYFNPNPAAGSYLATHWNVFNSVFEAACPTIGNACGSLGASVPVNAASPTVSGTAQSGSTLTASPGTWTGTPDLYTYQWQRTPVGGGAPVDVIGATGPTYAVGDTDVGRRIRVTVVASNAQGDSVPAPSSTTPTVVGAATAPPPTTTTTAPITPTVPVVTTPVTTTPVTPPIAPERRVTLRLKRGSRTVLKVAVTSRVRGSGVIASAAAAHVRLARRGTYRLTVCAGIVCVTKPFRARHGRARLPSIVAASTRPGVVTLRLTGPGGLATATLS